MNQPIFFREGKNKVVNFVIFSNFQLFAVILFGMLYILISEWVLRTCSLFKINQKCPKMGIIIEILLEIRLNVLQMFFFVNSFVKFSLKLFFHLLNYYQIASKSFRSYIIWIDLLYHRNFIDILCFAVFFIYYAQT